MTFQSLLTPNSTKLEIALEKSLSRSTQIDVEIDRLWNVDTMHEDFLPYLAWSVGCDIWSTNMNLEEKKILIKEYLTIRALKGTKAAIEKAYKVLGLRAEIIENPLDINGQPMAFKFLLRIVGQRISPNYLAEIRRMTDSLKPLKTYYDIEIEIDFSIKNQIASVLKATNIARFNFEV